MARDSRQLPTDADFAALVTGAGARVARGDDAALDACLLSGGGDVFTPFLVAAELAPALQPMPPPPAILEPEWTQATDVRVLTRWSSPRAGDDSAGFAVAALTSTPPESANLPPLLLLLDAAGAYVLPHRTGSDKTGPHDLDTLTLLLLARIRAQPHSVFVAATADVSLARIRAVLAVIPETVPSIAFAVPLPARTRLPTPGAATPEPAHTYCPDGLPDPEPRRAAGELDAHSIASALQPWRQQAQRCLTEAGSATALGGALSLAARVAEPGRIEQVCLFHSDFTGVSLDAAVLHACLMEALRNVRFPPPSPSGFVDFMVPLSFTASPTPPLRPLCN